MSHLVKLSSVPLLLALIACGPSPEAPAAAAGAVAAALTTSGVNATMALDTWGGGYCANVTLTNTSSAAVTSWTLVAQLNQSSLNNVWGGTAAVSGTQLTLRPLDYDATIAPGAAVTLGFCGTATGTSSAPALLSLSVVGGSSGPTTCTLTVARAGAGAVTSAPAGIDCGTVCAAPFPCGTLVTLTTAAASGATFAGWGGPCTGTAACSFALSASQTVNATFDAPVTTYPLDVTKGGTGAGTVTGPNIDCGATCTATFPSGTTVTLTAAAASGSAFTGWSGTCTGTAATCTASMTAARTATATFTAASNAPIRGVNWADTRDNFVNGVLYVSGLGASDSYASASTVASRVIGQLYSIAGANTVRMPINEPTVGSYWSTYTGAIDAALAQGRVILAYWAYTGGKPQSTSAFYAMWDKVVARYGSNPDAYFEVINEPSGYAVTDLDNLYNDWLNRYASVPRARVILDGAGLAQDASAVGRDSRLNGTLIAVHDYSFFAGYESENEWANHLGGYIGAYAGRTVVTEWGGPMGPGSKNGVAYDAIDYSIPSGSFFADYLRGISSELRTLGVGSVYWPGLRDGDWYSLTRKSGSGASLQLSLVNASGLARLQYAWGVGTGGGTYVQIRNTATGLFLDGTGAASGAGTNQSSAAGAGAQWVVENSGSYVRIRNRATGLYLDGMGRTANGAAVAQYASSSATTQQWSVLTDANDVTIRNRATNLYLDGMGRATSGAAVGQYGGSGSSNQRWRIVVAP